MWSILRHQNHGRTLLEGVCLTALKGDRSKRLSYVRFVDDTATALQEMVDLANHFPGQYAPEFELGYWAGVRDGAERWYVHFEGDIHGDEFTVLGHTAADALRAAVGEAKKRAP